MKLISLIEKWKELRSTVVQYKTVVLKYDKYVEFIEQTPELYMFIAVDEEGNVLEEPEGWNMWINHDYTCTSEESGLKCQEYQKALSRVYFKNVEVRKYSNGDIQIEVSGNLIVWYTPRNKDWKFNHESLEDLTPLNLELTGNHLK